jgi:hypothetical protein
VGREAEVEAFRRALRNGPGDPARAMLLTGARGTGKTVLLNAIEAEASAKGWAVVSATMREGTVAQLTEAILPRLLNRHDPQAQRSRVVGGSASVLGIGGGVTRQVDDAHPVLPDFRLNLEDLARVMAAKGQGVLLTVDEIQRGGITELRELLQAVQHCFRQGLEVAFAGAGLPHAVNTVLNDDVLTFLRRSERFSLDLLDGEVVARAIREPVVAGGRTIEPEALARSVAAVDGYPFAVQLVGFHLWEADLGATTIDVAQADKAITAAQQRVAALVYEPMLSDLSAGDLRFLRAMAQEPAAAANLSAIAARIGSSQNQYRARLIAAELIEPADRGKLRFAIPGLRDHLQSGAQE